MNLYDVNQGEPEIKKNIFLAPIVVYKYVLMLYKSAMTVHNFIEELKLYALKKSLMEKHGEKYHVGPLKQIESQILCQLHELELYDLLEDLELKEVSTSGIKYFYEEKINELKQKMVKGNDNSFIIQRLDIQLKNAIKRADCIYEENTKIINVIQNIIKEVRKYSFDSKYNISDKLESFKEADEILNNLIDLTQLPN